MPDPPTTSTNAAAKTHRCSVATRIGTKAAVPSSKPWITIIQGWLSTLSGAR